MPLPPPAPNPQPLFELRRSRGLSQLDLAVQSGVDQPTISRLERGSQIPTREQIARLAKVLKVKAVDLFDRQTLTVVIDARKAAS